MTPWVTLATVQTAEGPLTLKQRGTTFHIVIGGRVLMTSAERRSEEALSTLALTNLPKHPRVLIGGLGMAYTLRAALDVLPGNAQVSVAELTPAVEEWCRGPMAVLTNNAVADKRVKILIGDVSRIIAEATPGTWDAILLDLYEGPNAATQRRDDPFYGPAALARSRTALTAGGVLSVWSEDPDTAFHKRFVAAGFDVGLHKLGSSRVHSVYLGRKR